MTPTNKKNNALKIHKHATQLASPKRYKTAAYFDETALLRSKQ